MGLLSQLEHERTIKPSTIISGYLFLSIVLSLPEARTLFSVQTNLAIPILYSVGLGLRVVTLVIESLPKTSILRPAWQNPPPEAATGVLGLSLFTWINPLLMKGNKEDLTVQNLPELEEDFTADGTGPNKLEVLWRKSKLLYF